MKRRYRINQIKLNLKEKNENFESALIKAAEKQLKRRYKRKVEISDVKIVKESIDARKKPDIRLVYTVDFSCDEKLNLPEAADIKYNVPEALQKNKEKAKIEGMRPVVVGFGPCGIFCAMMLAYAGLRPIVIERGKAVDERIKSVQNFWRQGKLDPESNVQFGEGGAGTFSDGKLTTGIKDIRIGRVLEEFVDAGADDSILYKQKPHIGTDKLRSIVKNLRKKIESLGGEVHFDTKLTDLDICENTLTGVYTSKKGVESYIKTNCLILAIGHSAYDTFKMLLDRGLAMEQKPFSIGVRIEHPQSMINRIQYGDERIAEIIGAAEYKLSYRCGNGRGVYTFCMCPGGEVIDSSSEEGTAVTNGMSESLRGGKYANSGLLVDVRTSDFSSEHPLAGFEFQRKYERLAYDMGKGGLPVSTYGEFKSDEDDCVRNSLPLFASEAILEAMPFLGRKLKGFDSDDARLKAVESRSSSPVRIKRNEMMQSAVNGVFPAGEGPGYAGGIISAAVDGIRVAEKVIESM